MVSVTPQNRIGCRSRSLPQNARPLYGRNLETFQRITIEGRFSVGEPLGSNYADMCGPFLRLGIFMTHMG